MKSYKVLFVLGLLMFVSVGAQSDCNKSKVANKSQSKKEMNMNTSNTKLPDEPVSMPERSDLKILAEGSYAKVEKPFIFVARTKETYAQMQNMAENLPAASGIDFTKSAVVAAFAGTKNTGGFSVDFTKSGGEVSVKIIAPPADAMTTQALTTPYKIALIPVEEENSFALNLAENWKNEVQIYKISSGEFTFSGGLTGRETKFEPQGTIDVLTSGEYVTLIFNLTGKSEASGRKLNEVASGNLKSGKADLARIEAGNFIDRPHPPLVVSGEISGEKLFLTFEPGKRDYVVNDGFEGRGKLEAAKIK